MKIFAVILVSVLESIPLQTPFSLFTDFVTGTIRHAQTGLLLT